MCISPILIDEGILVACRNCWQCTESAIDDWVGRCIAESLTSYETTATTLTYGRDENNSPDHIRAAILTYSDVQKYFKKLRYDNYPLKYFCVGEYGSLKGRAHWHIMLFFQERKPDDWKYYERYDQEHWEHGYTHNKPMFLETVRYNCKYIQKDENIQTHMAMSKKPPLGAAFVKDLAKLYVHQGIAPKDFSYSFPGITRSNGERKYFWLRGKCAEILLEEFIKEWQDKRPEQHIPASEVVEAYQDSLVLLDPLIPMVNMSEGEMIYRERMLRRKYGKKIEAITPKEEQD